MNCVLYPLHLSVTVVGQTCEDCRQAKAFDNGAREFKHEKRRRRNMLK